MNGFAGSASCVSLAIMNWALQNDTTVGAAPYRVTADDYLRMVGAGVFGDAHVELVEGELVEIAPAGLEHGKKNGGIAVDLGIVYKPLGYFLCIDSIVYLTPESVRAPDICVVDTEPADRNHLLPTDILLAVEIAQSTLAEDLGRKRIDYASAGIRHYWVVDVDGHRVHTYSEPQGADYSAIKVFGFGEAIPVPATGETITVA